MARKPETREDYQALGREARRRGEAITANPFAMHTLAWDWWREGWLDGKLDSATGEWKG